MSEVGDGTPLPAAFFARPARELARALLGQVLVSTIDGWRTAGRIVETEAYIGPDDPASHAARRIGRTARNASMFGPPGLAYVYRIYGIHWCLNVVSDVEGFPAAVLLRALEPLAGLGYMRQRRWPPHATGRDRDLARGPARLCQALGITGTLDGHSLRDPPLVVVESTAGAAADIVSGPRVGVTRAREWPLRFRLVGSPWVSRGG